MKKLLYKDGGINYQFVFWAGLLLLMLLRVFYFGIDYFTYLDDNNTYGVFYRRNGDIWNNIVLWYGLYTFRPIAFLADAYITQWFWPVMWLVLLFYTVMHFASIVLFTKTLAESKINFGPFGIIITAITPILLEAVYWIGASTRLVPGMFFSLLSCYILVRYGKSKRQKPLYMLLYFVTNVISTGFYEQIIVFNFVFTGFIIALNFREINGYKKRIIATPFVSTLFMGAYYLFFWNKGKVAARGQIAREGLISHFITTLKGIGNILIRQNIIVNGKGLAGFAAVEINILQGIALLLVLFFAVFVFYYMVKKAAGIKAVNKAAQIKVIVGIILAAAPFAPFFVLKNNYMSFRAVYPSIFGIAMFADGIFDKISESKRGNLSGKKAAAACTSAVIVLFFIINVVEIDNYRRVEACDDIIADNFLEAFEETGYSEDTPVIIFNTQYCYAQTSRPGYENISSSDWAFLGKANSAAEKFYFKTIVPVRNNESLKSLYLDGEAALFAIDDTMEITRLSHEGGALFDAEGNLYGRLTKASDEMVFFSKGKE